MLPAIGREEAELLDQGVILNATLRHQSENNTFGTFDDCEFSCQIALRKRQPVLWLIPRSASFIEVLYHSWIAS